MSTNAAGDSPILRTVLELIRGGATERDLEERFSEHGLTARAGLISETLATATELGLVRVASTGAAGPRRVLTSLGQRMVAGGPLGSDEADRLRDLESLRTDLSATIAHELRTPLTAIRTCASLLLSEDAHPTAEQHRTLVETIERNAERMQRVVGDILDLARFRAGGNQPPATPIRRHGHGGGGRPIDRTRRRRAQRRSGYGRSRGRRSRCTATTAVSSRRSSTSSRTRFASLRPVDA